MEHNNDKNNDEIMMTMPMTICMLLLMMRKMINLNLMKAFLYVNEAIKDAVARICCRMGLVHKL